eukprot:1804250-Rhodomonas_salina.2
MAMVQGSVGAGSRSQRAAISHRVEATARGGADHSKSATTLDMNGVMRGITGAESRHGASAGVRGLNWRRHQHQ